MSNQIPSSKRGLNAVTAEEFSPLDAMGGVRGLVESVLPGLLFIVIFLVTHELLWALIVSAAVALLTVAIRLVQRTPVSQAFGGILGIAIGVFWAWRTGDATDFFAFGLWQNAIYLAVVLVLQLISWPAVGLVIEVLRLGFNLDKTEPAPSAPIDPDGFVAPATDSGIIELPVLGQVAAANPVPEPDLSTKDELRQTFSGFSKWRSDPQLLRRYKLASWFWVGLFALRLAVQLPLFFGGSVGWLGTARLLMGVPLWALVLYATWVVIHGAHRKRRVA